MRPLVEAWLIAHGLPGWLAPDYLAMGGLGALAGGAFVLATADQAMRPLYARAMAAAYVASYVVGHLVEFIRLAPGRLLAGDFVHLFEVGRAAWGGLLGAVGVAAWVLWRARVPLAPFLDRVAVASGIVFALVRTGCFLAGCDYGTVTSSSVGVRFPAGSLAALDHAGRGWVTAGYASLPVHPTQLYEAAFGACSAVVLAVLFRRGVFRERLLWLFFAGYALFRFGNELLRGDVERGVAYGLSTAQVVSLLMLAALAFFTRRPSYLR